MLKTVACLLVVVAVATGELKPKGTLSTKLLPRGGGEAVKSYHDWDLMKADIAHADKVVVLDFSARWCGPCRAIAAPLEAFAGVMDDVIFMKVDVDEVPEASMHYDVSALPTFILVKDGVELGRFEGASLPKLKQMLTDNGCNVPSNDVF